MKFKWDFLEEAICIFKKSIKIYNAKLGVGSIISTTAISNLAALYRQKEDYAKESRYYLKSLKILHEKLWEWHPFL